MNKVLSSLLILFASQFCLAETIHYEIYERADSGEFTKLVASGSRTYGARDLLVSPYERDGQRIKEVLVELEGGYKIGARIFTEKRLTGFGLLAKRTDRDFSWEWYNKGDNGKFVKLQGGTVVTVKAIGLPLMEELSEVKFDEDAHLTFTLNRAGHKDTHLIVVKAGSVLRLSAAP